MRDESDARKFIEKIMHEIQYNNSILLHKDSKNMEIYLRMLF